MSNTDPDINIFTNKPFADDAERQKAGALLSKISTDPEIRFSNNDRTRRGQLRAFWQGAGQILVRDSAVAQPVPPVKEVNGGQRMGIFDYPGSTLGQLSEADIRLVEQGQASYADFRKGDAERFISLFPRFRPGSRREQSVAMGGLSNQIVEAAVYSYRSAEDLLARARGWHREAEAEYTALHSTPNGLGDVANLRTSPTGVEEAMMAMAQVRVDGLQFEKQKWTKVGSKPHRELFNSTLAELQSLSDDQLVVMHATALNAADARAEFWDQQVHNAQNLPLVQRLEGDRTYHSQQ